MPYSRHYLVRTKLTDQSYLASLGAFITIAALAVDPFSQQVIQYYDCLQTDTGSTARIPKTNRYSVGGMHTGARSATLDGPTQVAIYMGLLSPPANSSASISVDCPTGNCTFPATDDGATFSTLAICRSCSDISSTVTVNDTTTPVNYTLDSGPWVGQQVLASTAGKASTNNAIYTFEALMLNYPDNCTATDSLSSDGGCWPEDPFAVRCSLRPCLQTYGANVTENVYAESLVSSTPLPYVIDNGWWWILAANRTLVDGAWRDCNASTAPTSTNTVGITENGTVYHGGEAQAAGGVTYYPDACVWVFNYTAALPLGDFLYDMFEGSNVQFYASPSALVSELWLENLYRNGSASLATVDAFMDGLATSMTANVRTRGETASGGYAQGTPLVSRTCIRVRWAWFALPTALWVLAVGFLAALLLRSAFRSEGRLWWQQGTWKSSVLVPFFHGLDGDTLERFRGGPVRADTNASAPAVSGREMQDMARSTRVRLCYEDSGLKFVGAAAGEKGGEVSERSESGLDESSAQQSSPLVPNPDVSVANNPPRSRSPVSWRSVSPPA